MSAASKTCSQTTCAGIPSATSSPASADGATRSDSPDGLMTDLFGREVVLVSPSVPPGKARASLIPVISGRRGFGSSESARLQRFLASKLRERLAWRGSILFRLTWSRQVTQSGRLLCQLRALVDRTAGHAYFGLPTPCARDWQDQGRLSILKRQNDKPSGGGLLPRRLASMLLEAGWEDVPHSLNPCFARLMMGYPAVWDACAPTGTRSSRRSRPSSLGRISTR
jgi:hypothetical protein